MNQLWLFASLTLHRCDTGIYSFHVAEMLIKSFVLIRKRIILKCFLWIFSDGLPVATIWRRWLPSILLWRRITIADIVFRGDTCFDTHHSFGTNQAAFPTSISNQTCISRTSKQTYYIFFKLYLENEHLHCLSSILFQFCFLMTRKRFPPPSITAAHTASTRASFICFRYLPPSIVLVPNTLYRHYRPENFLFLCPSPYISPIFKYVANWYTSYTRPLSCFSPLSLSESVW